MLLIVNNGYESFKILLSMCFMIHELREHTDWLLLITYTLIILDVKIDLTYLYLFFDKLLRCL